VPPEGVDSAVYGRLARLLDAGDDAALAEIIALMDTDDEALKAQAVRGVVQYFPARALGVFEAMSVSESPRLRIASAYGLGLLTEGDTLPVLLGLLRDPEKKVRRGAYDSLGRPFLAAGRSAVNLAGGVSDHVAEESLAAIARVRAAVLAEVLSDDPPPGLHALHLLETMADPQTAEALVAAYGRGKRGEEASLARLIGRMQQANRNWLGRPVVPPMQEAALTLEVYDPERDRTRTQQLRLTPAILEVARRRVGTSERCMRLPLPLDALVVVPQLLAPEAASGQGPRVQVRYRPADRDFAFGLGAFGSFTWISRLPVAQAVVTVERKRAIPLEERLLDETGNVVASIAYSDWEQAGPSAWFPGRVTIEVPSVVIADAHRHVRYDLDFQLVQGLWTLRQADVFELGLGSKAREALRASARVTEAVVRPPVPTAATAGAGPRAGAP
jgi:hypothetical protein